MRLRAASVMSACRIEGTNSLPPQAFAQDKVLRLRFGRAMAPKQRVWDVARLEQAACAAASEKAAAIKSSRGDVSRVTCRYLGRGSAPRARLSCIFAAFLAVPQVRWCGSGTWQIRFFAAGR